MKQDMSLRVDPAICRLQEHIVEAQRELSQAMREKFLPGTRISWIVQRGGKDYEQLGTVVTVSENWWSEPSMMARNETTNKLVRVTLSMFPMKRVFRKAGA